MNTGGERVAIGFDWVFPDVVRDPASTMCEGWRQARDIVQHV